VEQQRKRNGEGNGLAPKLINAAGRAVTGEMGMSQMYRLNAATGLPKLEGEMDTFRVE
jgi:hypothetical protein